MKNFSELKSKLAEATTKLSAREQLILAVMLICVIVYLGDTVITPVQSAFSSQQETLDKLKRNAQDVPFVIERYVKLSKRKKQLEREFKDVEIKEGPLAYIESLVKDKAGISKKFTIKDQRSKKVGEQYVQTPFYVRFQISEMTKLVKFLDSIVNGDKPLALNQIKLTKKRTGDALDVEMEVYSIKKL